MTKESIYELQRIDCNCNDCGFMKRNFDAYKKWEAIEKVRQEKEFENKKEQAFEIANNCEDEKGKQSLLNIAKKMRFLFDKSKLLQYGDCLQFNKSVSFIVGICQIETQKCFIHRKDYTHYEKETK